MGKPFWATIDAFEGISLIGDGTPVTFDFDDGSVAFEASIFADSDGISKELRLVVDGTDLITLDATTTGAVNVLVPLVGTSDVQADRLIVSRNVSANRFVAFDAAVGHEAAIRFNEASDEMLLFIEDGGTTLKITPDLVEVSGEFTANGISLREVGGAKSLYLPITGTTGSAEVTFFHIDASRAGRIAYNASTTLGASSMVFSTDGSVWMTVDGSGLDIGRAMSLLGPLTVTGTTGSANMALRLEADSDSNYDFYADNTGSGSDNTRLWLDGPEGGQVVIGPRSGSVRLNDIRLRADNVYIDAPPYSGSSGFPVAFMRQGTWTPSILGGGSDPFISYTLRDGKYLRIGDLVFVSAHITINTISLGSGQAIIFGLPYTIWNANGYRTIFNVSLAGAGWPASRTAPWGAGTQNTKAVGLVAQGDNVSFGAVAVTSLAAGDDIWLSGFYWTAET